jgi:hypothetical protein
MWVVRSVDVLWEQIFAADVDELTLFSIAKNSEFRFVVSLSFNYFLLAMGIFILF